MKFCFESIQQQSHSLFVDGLAVVPLTRRLYVPENDFLEDTAENHGELELSEQFESTKPLVLSKYFGDLKISLKMSRTVSKKSKDDANIEEINISDEAKSMIEKILGDVSKTSATKQIIIGTTSGWATGFMTMKVGKMAALAFGGGIIMLQIAAHQGYIKVNWDQIQKKAEKISDKVEEKVTGEGPKLLDKVERYVDKKLDKAEQLLKNGESRTRRWYHSVTGDTTFKPKEFHFFITSFVAGLAIGLATGN